MKITPIKPDSPRNIRVQFIFDSVTALGDYAAHAAERYRERLGSSLSSGTDVTNHHTLDDAIACAQAGGRWDVGIDELASHITADEMPTTERQVWRPKVAGSRACVPRHMTGAPNSMMRSIRAQVPRPVLRMAVAIGRLYRVKQPASFNRGSAVIRAVQHLESIGNRVELWAIWRNGDQNGNYVSIETCIKRADRGVDIGDIAYPLCHLAFQRRLCWAVMETDIDARFLAAGGGYGQGMDAQYGDYDLHIGYMEPGTQWDSPESASKYVQAELQKQLTKLGAA